MNVTSVTHTSISLSWSVSSGSVLSSEVVWRDTDEETNSSSGSLLGTTYTIDLLRSFTLYNITVAVTYSAGYTDTSHLSVSTGIMIDYPLHQCDLWIMLFSQIVKQHVIVDNFYQV